MSSDIKRDTDWVSAALLLFKIIFSIGRSHIRLMTETQRLLNKQHSFATVLTGLFHSYNVFLYFSQRELSSRFFALELVQGST